MSKVIPSPTDQLFIIYIIFFSTKNVFCIFVVVEDLVILHCTKLLSCYRIKCAVCIKDLKIIMVNDFKFDTKQEWFVHSSLSWLRTIVCYMESISLFECILRVFSEYVCCLIKKL